MSAFDNLEPVEDESVEEAKQILAELESIVPAEKMEALKRSLTAAFEDEFNAGYRLGVKDAESRR